MTRYTLTTTRMEILYAGEHRTFNQALESAIAKGIRLTDMDLRHLDLRHITLDGGQFHNCMFDDSNMQGANLSECTFTLCDFKRTNLSGACLCYTDMIACDILTANLKHSDFAEAYLLHCLLPDNPAMVRLLTYCFDLKDCVLPRNTSHPIPNIFSEPLISQLPLKKLFYKEIYHTKDITNNRPKHV